MTSRSMVAEQRRSKVETWIGALVFGDMQQELKRLDIFSGKSAISSIKMAHFLFISLKEELKRQEIVLKQLEKVAQRKEYTDKLTYL